MTAEGEDRSYGRLTAPCVSSELSEQSILCLPVGSLEQHGPHLPLNTDAVIAERFAARLATHVADRYDLWVVPPVPYGLSPEHVWASGTITLNIALYTSLIETLVGEYVRSTPAQAILIVNGHGGNKGVLEALVHQLQRTHDVATCVVNPGSLAASQLQAADEFPEVHAGIRETSLMLALAPDHVRLDLLPNGSIPDLGQREEIQRLVFGRGVTWPWSSGSPAISAHGVIGGDPRHATAEHGQTLVTAALHACTDILDRLVRPTPHEPTDVRRANESHS
ncbi:creatininase family protein [Kribbella qitaiheensis]|uniref:creatininase family protein n=1 Tax=Kribbella qitaiheensis TaxID=1544730 RepID=UPI00162720E9|nr:creatininase family protein [Kribbella qitaiheensis]